MAHCADVVLAFDKSVGVFLKKVAFVAPSWFLLPRSPSLHQGDIQEWQRNPLLRRRSTQQGPVNLTCCFLIASASFPKGDISVPLDFHMTSSPVVIHLVRKWHSPQPFCDQPEKWVMCCLCCRCVCLPMFPKSSRTELHGYRPRLRAGGVRGWVCMCSLVLCLA